MLEESLKRLQTDHLDVWQIHEVIYDNDPDLIFAPDGAAEALDAGEEGRARCDSSASPATRIPRIHLRDARARLSVRHRADAAELLRRELPQLRAAGAAGGATGAGSRALGMKSMGGSGEMVRHGAVTRGGGAAVRDEPAGRGDDQRHGVARGAAAEPRRSRAASSRCPRRRCRRCASARGPTLRTGATSCSRRRRSTTATWGGSSTVSHRRTNCRCDTEAWLKLRTCSRR